MTPLLPRAFASLCAALPLLAGAASRPTVELQCVSFGSGPQLECTVRLQADGKPLTGAQVRLGASMPSMPMAHHVRPATAEPTGAPGEYRGRLELEMTGAWAVQVDIAGPARERFAKTLRVDECAGEQRCPAPPVAAKSAATPSSTTR